MFINNGDSIVTEEFDDLLVLGKVGEFQRPVVVEMSVLKQLTNTMVSIHFDEAKANLKAKLKHIDNMEDYVDLLEKELAFHKTVDTVLKDSYCASKRKPHPASILS